MQTRSITMIGAPVVVAFSVVIKHDPNGEPDTLQLIRDPGLGSELWRWPLDRAARGGTYPDTVLVPTSADLIDTSAADAHTDEVYLAKTSGSTVLFEVVNRGLRAAGIEEMKA